MIALEPKVISCIAYFLHKKVYGLCGTPCMYVLVMLAYEIFSNNKYFWNKNISLNWS